MFGFALASQELNYYSSPKRKNQVLSVLLRLLSAQFDDLLKFFQDFFVVIFVVRKGTIRTIFDSIVCVNEMTTAVGSERVQRTKTKQTVKIVRMRCFVAGEIGALGMLEKTVILHETDSNLTLPFEWQIAIMLSIGGGV